MLRAAARLTSLGLANRPWLAGRLGRLGRELYRRRHDWRLLASAALSAGHKCRRMLALCSEVVVRPVDDEPLGAEDALELCPP